MMINSTPVFSPRQQHSTQQTAVPADVYAATPIDTVSISRKARTENPKFSGWGSVFLKTLPFISAGLEYEKKRIDRSMAEDDRRRKARKRYEEIGRSYKEYDGRGYYRVVTPIKVIDGNGKVLDRKERVGRWHRDR